MTDDEGRTQLHVGLDPETKRRIRVEAARQDKTMSELAREVMEEWVEEQAVTN